MASILDHLRAEHERLRRSLLRLREESSPDPQRLCQLMIQYTAYARAEESVFYSYLIHVKEAQDRAVQGIEEHERLAALLRRTELVPLADPRRRAAIASLCETFSQHLHDEERHLFALARRALSEREAAGLGACFVAEHSRFHRDLGRLDEGREREPPRAAGRE